MVPDEVVLFVVKERPEQFVVEILKGIALEQSLFGGKAQVLKNAALTVSFIGAQLLDMLELKTTKERLKFCAAAELIVTVKLRLPLDTVFTFDPEHETPVGVLGINTEPVKAQSKTKLTLVPPQFNVEGVGVTESAKIYCVKNIAVKRSRSFFITKFNK